MPRQLLKRIKRLAADKEISVSSLMSEALARLADEDRRYSAARKRALAALRPLALSVRVAAAPGHATNSMSAEGTREFVDTNVLVYAFDASAQVKRDTAARLIERLWASASGCVSVQVLQEFFVTVTRKAPQPLSIDEAAERVRELAAWNVFAPSANDVLDAIALHKCVHMNGRASRVGAGLQRTLDGRFDGQTGIVRCENPQSVYSRSSQIESPSGPCRNLHSPFKPPINSLLQPPLSPTSV